MSLETEILSTLLNALKVRDGDTMASLYHPEATFEDEVFCLKGAEIGAMWQMLCQRGKDLELTYSQLNSAKAGEGRVHWEPVYSFSGTGRKVHNRIDTVIELKDGKIWRQRDRFNFWRWSMQALGPAGLALGWTPLLRNKVKATARQTLEAFIKKNSQP
ncbi:MAG: nuclear transport factor 2 family protein [Hahellaceae bacterium]|nr:nuclear transport factor 2 family protein [Hahellaceae bacterium]